MGNVDIDKFLINHGANVDATAAERGGGTALQLAATRGYAPIMLILLSHKANVDVPGSKTNDLTALECAAQGGYLDPVQILLNAGAGSKPGTVDQVHRSITLAKDNGHDAVVDLLTEHLNKVMKADVP